MTKPKAVVLFSGGLDSTVCIAQAQADGYDVTTLTIDYGQRHLVEITQAAKIAYRMGAVHRCISIPVFAKTSSLVNKTMAVPTDGHLRNHAPSTYVPGRNALFLSYAASLAEEVGAERIYVGFSGGSSYPDSQPQFFRAYNRMLATALKSTSQEHKQLEVMAPLIESSKAEIVRLGVELMAPIELSWSCYSGGSIPCKECDSCRQREEGFMNA